MRRRGVRGKRRGRREEEREKRRGRGEGEERKGEKYGRPPEVQHNYVAI